VGKPLPNVVTAVNGWPIALRNYTSQKWQNCCLMARNRLFECVQRKSWERAQDWGPLSDELRPVILSFVESCISKYPIPVKLSVKVRAQLSWDIMLICFEEEYRDLVGPIFYLLLLDPWYAEGHLPCGWEGKEFPDGWDGIISGGKLMVF
jgi:hypothetical protein